MAETQAGTSDISGYTAASKGFDYGQAFSGIGSLFSAFGNIYAARNTLLMSEYQVDMAESAAGYIDAKTRLQRTVIERHLDKIIGRQRARDAANNIMPDVGTPEELQIESEILSEIDATMVTIAGDIDKLELMTAAQMGRADAYGKAGQYADRAGAYAFDEFYNIGRRQGWFKGKGTTPRQTQSLLETTTNPKYKGQ